MCVCQTLDYVQHQIRTIDLESRLKFLAPAGSRKIYHTNTHTLMYTPRLSGRVCAMCVRVCVQTRERLTASLQSSPTNIQHKSIETARARTHQHAMHYISGLAQAESHIPRVSTYKPLCYKCLHCCPPGTRRVCRTARGADATRHLCAPLARCGATMRWRTRLRLFHFQSRVLTESARLVSHTHTHTPT